MNDVRQRAQIFLELAERNGADWPTDADMMVAFHEFELRRGQTPRCPKCKGISVSIDYPLVDAKGKTSKGWCDPCDENFPSNEFFPASGVAAPPVDVRELAKEIVRKFCFPTTDPDFPGTVAAEQVKAISEIINRALGQEEPRSPRDHELLREALDFITDQYGPGLDNNPASEAYLLAERIKAHLAPASEVWK